MGDTVIGHSLQHNEWTVALTETELTVDTFGNDSYSTGLCKCTKDGINATSAAISTVGRAGRAGSDNTRTDDRQSFRQQSSRLVTVYGVDEAAERPEC